MILLSIINLHWETPENVLPNIKQDLLWFIKCFFKNIWQDEASAASHNKLISCM